MRNTALVACILASLFSWHEPVQAQTAIPAPVVADPAADTQFPPYLAGTTISSHGVEMDAMLYVASGAGPHGTVLLLHGLPGYETNGDVAQSIRRAGWNVLMFHYRGTWGTAGKFSLSSAIDDTVEAVRFLRDSATATKYRADSKQIVVIGHSFGGFLAGYEASHDQAITAVAMIAAVNLGRINDDAKERAARLKRWENQLHPVRDASAAELFDEAARHKKDWDYVGWADALLKRPVLLVEADDQNHADVEALARALTQKGAVALTRVGVATDHSFSDHRIALQSIVIEWLNKIPKTRQQRR